MVSGMFKSYLLIAFRVLTSNKLFSMVNILGLSTGLCITLLIVLFVQYELSYEHQYSDYQNIYRVERNFLNGKEVGLALATNAPQSGPLILSDFKEVHDMTRILRTNMSVAIDDLHLVEEDMGLADGNVLHFFGIQLLEGDINSALSKPGSLIVSKSTAEKYFGEKNPVGQQILLSGSYLATVTGVFEDLPRNTHIKLNAIAPIRLIVELYGEHELENWGANSYYTYIKVDDNFNPNSFNEKLPEFIDKHLSKNAHEWTSMSIQKLADIHLYSNKQMEFSQNGSIGVVITFISIAFCVLLIACINFINLSTARSILRAKEVGVRKALGADKTQLVIQFLCESILLTTIAMILALGMAEWLTPHFSKLIDRNISLDTFVSVKGAFVLLFSILVVGALAGSYPALYLSKFNPVTVLRGKTSGSSSTAIVRKFLVVFQFTISICLIIATAIIYSQLKYVKNTELGYDRENNIIAVVPRNLPLWETYLPFKEQLLQHDSISSVTISSRVPTNDLLDGSLYYSSDLPAVEENFKDLRDVKVGYSFFEHYGVELVAGRFFSEDYNDIDVDFDKETRRENSFGNIIINESALSKLGFADPGEAIGKVVVQVSDSSNKSVRWTVVGVVKDINFASMRAEKGAIAFTPITSYDQKIVSIKYKPDTEYEVLSVVNTSWSTIAAGYALALEFLEDRFISMYRDENRQAIVFSIFAMLAVLVATLGLFGLVSFSTERRSKEIAVRKIMGASISDIILLLTTDFSRLILLANVIAWPIAYILMRQWLSKFVYAVPISPSIFILSSIAVLFFAWFILVTQTSKIANSKPVNALRTE